MEMFHMHVHLQTCMRACTHSSTSIFGVMHSGTILTSEQQSSDENKLVTLLSLMSDLLFSTHGC